MKKVFTLIIALATFASNAMALDYEPEQGVTWMGIFGMNVSKLQNHPYNAKAGAVLGAKVDYVLPYAHGTYLTAGLDWSIKGGKRSAVINDGSKDYDATGKYALHYVEIPVRVGFRYNMSDEFGIYGELGPYFAVGVGGRHKLSIEGDGQVIDDIEDAQTYKAFKKDNSHEYFQRWDAGIGFRIGAEYNKHYNLMLGCDWGLADMYRDSYRSYWYDKFNETLPKPHNFNLSIAFGYRF